MPNAHGAGSRVCGGRLATIVATVAFFPGSTGAARRADRAGRDPDDRPPVVPVLRAISGSDETTNAENFVMVGFVFWLLLDLLQGAYDLREASNESLRDALDQHRRIGRGGVDRRAGQAVESAGAG